MGYLLVKAELDRCVVLSKKEFLSLNEHPLFTFDKGFMVDLLKMIPGRFCDNYQEIFDDLMEQPILVTDHLPKALEGVLNVMEIKKESAKLEKSFARRLI